MQYNEAGALSNRYLFGIGMDQVLAEKIGNEVYWALADHQGTIKDFVTYNDTTDETTVANHRKFDSFGNLTDETNPAVNHHFGYTGRALLSD